jgi:hypothetical protein
MFGKLCAVMLVVSALTGCAASGELYNDVLKKQVAVDAEKGKLIFFRNTSTMAASGVAARVMVDNANLKYVSYGGFTIYPVPPGPYHLSVHLGVETNRCQMRVSVSPGEELFFELKPNKERIFSEAISGGINAGFAHKGIYGAPAPYQEGAVPVCGSYFSMVQRSREDALRELESIRETKQ